VSLIGVDIGGTKTRVALLTPEGTVLARRSTPTRAERGHNAALEQLIELIGSLQNESASPLDGIGIAVTGPVNTQTGIVDNPHTLRGWGPTDLVSPLRRCFGVTVEIENDANAAALGEWWRGAGTASKRLAVVTIGTGIGVGLLVDGVVQRKSDGRHGEAGHHVLDPQGPRCYCGARGCWEVLAAGPAMARTALALGTEGAPAEIHDHDAISDAVISAALTHDSAATRVMDRIAQWVGLGLVNLIAFFMPDTVVLGGGVGARCFELMAPTIEATLARHKSMVPTDVSLRIARTGDDAGLLGAGLLVAALPPDTDLVTPNGARPASETAAGGPD
jgi:glucokinase